MDARRAVRVHEPSANVSGAVSGEAAGLEKLGTVLISREREDVIAVESAYGTVNREAQVRGRGGGRRLRIADLHSKALGTLVGRRTRDGS